MGTEKTRSRSVNRTIATEREQRDLPAFDVGRGKKGKSLDMVPMKVGKRYYDRLFPQERHPA